MWFSKKQKDPVASRPEPVQPQLPLTGHVLPAKQTNTIGRTKKRGDAAERQAERHLMQAGLQLVARNCRTPGRGGGEIDLVIRAPDGTVVFVEVRQRASASHGGAGASISHAKQQRIIYAARHFLMRFASPPPCRFDVVLVQSSRAEGSLAAAAPPQLEWLRAAFDAS
jgi:putative endonuclease